MLWIGLRIVISAGVTFFLATGARAQFLPVGAGPYDYGQAQNWANNTINGIFAQQLAADQTIGFAANTNLTTGLTFAFDGYSETLRGLGGDRTITLGGNITVRSSSGGRTVRIGSAGAGEQLTTDFGSAPRTINVAATDTLMFSNTVQRIWPLNKVGKGTLIFSGPATFDGGVNLSQSNEGGTLVLDHRTENSPKLPRDGGLSIASSTTKLLGHPTQSTNEGLRYLITLSGASVLALEGSGTPPVTLQIAQVTQNGNLGATVDFVPPMNGGIYTETQNTRGILGAFATVRETSWPRATARGRSRHSPDS